MPVQSLEPKPMNCGGEGVGEACYILGWGGSTAWRPRPHCRGRTNLSQHVRLSSSQAAAGDGSRRALPATPLHTVVRARRSRPSYCNMRQAQTAAGGAVTTATSSLFANWLVSHQTHPAAGTRPPAGPTATAVPPGAASTDRSTGVTFWSPKLAGLSCWAASCAAEQAASLGAVGIAQRCRVCGAGQAPHRAHLHQ